MKIVSEYLYHIYNRRTEKLPLFLGPDYYQRFLGIIEHYRSFDYPYSKFLQRIVKAKNPEEKELLLKDLEKRRINPLVKIISFCLMPNHYHLTLQQLVKNGISKFMHKIGTSFANFFNIKNERSGRLYENTFLRRRVESDEDLDHLTRYQHLNPSGIVASKEELITYPWSSLSDYVGREIHSFVETDMVMSRFKDANDYLEFVLAEIDEFEAVRLEEIAIDDDFGWFAEFRSLKKEKRERLREKFLEL